MDIHITGTEIAYLYVCRRKLWFFHNGMRPEPENELVLIGRIIHENSFSRMDKELRIGDVGFLDWAEFEDGIIHETKKGHHTSADRAQVCFYMKILSDNGVFVRSAKIHFPKQRRIVEIPWDDKMRDKAECDIEEVHRVVSSEFPEKAVRRPACKKCAYEEICFA